MYPSATDKKHRDWINSVMSTPDGPADAVDQLIYAAFECAVSILREAGSQVMFVRNLNAYQLDLFLFKDIGIGGILAKFISKMNDPEILEAMRATSSQSRLQRGMVHSTQTT